MTDRQKAFLIPVLQLELDNRKKYLAESTARFDKFADELKAIAQITPGMQPSLDGFLDELPVNWFLREFVETAEKNLADAIASAGPLPPPRKPPVGGSSTGTPVPQGTEGTGRTAPLT